MTDQGAWVLTDPYSGQIWTIQRFKYNYRSENLFAQANETLSEINREADPITHIRALWFQKQIVQWEKDQQPNRKMM